MTTTQDQFETTTPRKPKLAECMEALGSLSQQIEAASHNYKQAKTLLMQARSEPGSIDLAQFEVRLHIPGTDYDVPLDYSGNTEQAVVSAIESAAAALGAKLVALWEDAHAVTCEAVEHCRAAAEAAVEAANQES